MSTTFSLNALRTKTHSQRIFYFLLWLGISGWLSPVEAQSASANILSVSPTGKVGLVQQVRMVFSTNMTPMGDPRTQEAPAQLTCQSANQADNQAGFELPQTTRWVNAKEWLIELENPIPSGYRCHLTPTPNLKDLAGTPVKSEPTYLLNVSYLNIERVLPSEGSRIDPNQYIVIQTNEDLNKQSVTEQAFFEIEGRPDKIPVKLITPNPEFLEHVLHQNSAIETNEGETVSISGTVPGETSESTHYLILASELRFPEGQTVVLHWPKTIQSKEGGMFEKEYLFKFKTMDLFTAKLSCERTQSDRPCMPITPIYLDWSSPVSIEKLKGTRLVSRQGKQWIPEEFKSNKPISPTLQQLTFSPPFPALETFTFEIPNQLRDELDRPLSNANEFPLSFRTDEAPPLIKFAAPFGLVERYPTALLPVSVRNVESLLKGQTLVPEINELGDLKNLSDTENTDPSSSLTGKTKQMIKKVGSWFKGKQIQMTNLEDAVRIIEWYRRVQEKQWEYGGHKDTRDQSIFSQMTPKQKVQLQTFSVPSPNSQKDIEVIGIPLPKPGFYVVEIASPKLGQALLESKKTMYVSTTALVTDLSVHLKRGRTSSLVWVTRLSNAKPVTSAQVVLVNENGKIIAKSQTNENGVAQFGPLKSACPNNNEEDTSCELFAFAKEGDDLSFVSSNWNQGIEPFRFNVPREYGFNAWQRSLAHTVLDRMVVRAGDTIHMKHILRDRNQNGFTLTPTNLLPKRVFIRHEGNQTIYPLNVEIDPKTGNAINQFTLPKDAALGRYGIYLSQRTDQLNEDWYAKPSGYFIVSEFRLPLMGATVKPQYKKYVFAPKSTTQQFIQADLSAYYLSGGPASQLPVKLRTQLTPTYFSPEVLGAPNEFRFFANPIQTTSTVPPYPPVPPGTQAIPAVPGARAISFDESSLLTSNNSSGQLELQQLKLDATGGLKAQIPIQGNNWEANSLQIEMEYQDPNGETRIASAETLIFPSSTAIGLRTDTWYTEPGKAMVNGIIVDLEGKIKPNHPYKVEAFETRTISHRKRLVGGFYAYDSKTEITSKGFVCEGKSDGEGRFECNPKLPAGDYQLQASTQDSQGRTSYSTIDMTFYETGSNRWWAPSDSDRIDLIPLQAEYVPGDNARIIVKTPYQNATMPPMYLSL
jgi:hypothetical protein